MKHISGLDTLRFICAFIVVMGHFAIPLPDELGLLSAVWNNFFNGPAAVMVFFIVSGLCIHAPQTRSDAAALDIPKFYVRRGVRIAIPTVATIALYLGSGVGLYYPTFSVLWSIICEAIYYLLYPVILLPLRRRFGWMPMIIVSFAVVLVAAAANLDLLATRQNNFVAFGYWTWVAGLPAWLAGCWLAENLNRFPALSPAGMWSVRLGVLALSVVLRVIKFHVTAPWGSNVIWLTLFAGVFVLWVGLEIAYRRQHQPNETLERCGRWSFSLYLVHPVVERVTQTFSPHWTAPVASAGVALALLAAFIFYLAIERPSHRLAQRLGRRQLRGFREQPV